MSYKEIRAHFQSVFQKNHLWATWEVQLDHLTLDLLEESFLCLALHATQWGFRMILLLQSPSRWRLLVRSGYLSVVWIQHPTPVTEELCRKIQCPPGLIAHNRWYPYTAFPHWQEHPPSISKSPRVLGVIGFGRNVSSKILVFGTTTSSKQAEELLGTFCAVLHEMLYSQNSWIWTKVEGPVVSLVGIGDDHAAWITFKSAKTILILKV